MQTPLRLRSVLGTDTSAIESAQIGYGNEKLPGPAKDCRSQLGDDAWSCGPRDEDERGKSL